MIDERLANLRSVLAERELDAFVSLKLVNTYYLSGFTSLDTARPTSYTRPIAVVVDAFRMDYPFAGLVADAAD